MPFFSTKCYGIHSSLFLLHSVFDSVSLDAQTNCCFTFLFELLFFVLVVVDVEDIVLRLFRIKYVFSAHSFV